MSGLLVVEIWKNDRFLFELNENERIYHHSDTENLYFKNQGDHYVTVSWRKERKRPKLDLYDSKDVECDNPLREFVKLKGFRLWGRVAQVDELRKGDADAEE